MNSTDDPFSGEYDTLFNEFEKKRNQNELDRLKQNKLDRSMAYATRKNPSKTAEVYQIAEKRGLPPDYVERNLDKVQSVKLDYSNLPPVLRRFLSDPRYAAISHDDIGALTQIENVYRSLSEGVFQYVGGNVEGAGRLLEAGGRTAARGLDLVLPESVDRFIWETPETPAWAKIDPADPLRLVGGGVKQLSQNVGPPQDHKNLATDIASGLGQAIGQIATYLMSPQVGIAALFAQGVDQQGERQEASGTEGKTLTSDLALVAGGVATAASEKVGIDVLLNRIPPAIKNKIAQQVADLAIAGGAEAVQEVTEGVAQGLIEQMTTNPDAQIFEGLDREAITAGGVGVILRGILNAATPGRQVSQTERVEQLAESFRSSKVASRSPEEFMKHIEEIQEEYGTIDNLYLDAAQARELFQGMKRDPARDLIEQQLDEAEAVGGDIVIPMGEFATKVAQSENFGLLKPHLRVTPDTPSEVRDVDAILKQATENAEIKQRADQIFTEITDQLIATGRMDRESAKVSAKIIPAYVATRAARSGLSVDEVYDMMGLKVVGPQAEVQGDTILDQPAYEDAPVVFEEVRNQFLDALPEDASFDELMDSLDQFTPEQRSFIKALDRDDWLGFDVPSQAISTALSGSIGDFETSISLRQSIGRLVNKSYQQPTTNERDFDQPDQKEKQDSPRGIISILPEETVIKLTEASDLTTFLHESGHLFLEMEGKLFNHPKASDQVKKDGQAILDWLGAKSFDDISVEQHEKWARGFEKYLGEGKAPSIELQSAFRRFAAWMKQVYRSLTGLNVELTDEIRQVMDRMLASDEQIARVQQNFEPLFTSAEDAGMTQAEYRAYRGQGPEQAKEQLQTRLFKELERQHKAWWKDELAAVKKKVKKEFSNKPEYLAEFFFKKGDWIGRGSAPKGLSELDKLNLDQVKDLYEKIPPRLKGIAKKDGFDIDAAAQVFGFASGADMLTAINDSLPISKAINDTAEQRMLIKHGDALSDGTLQKKAEQAVHNLEQGKRLLSELQALSRRTGRPVADREAMKEYAKSKVGKMRYKDIKPSRYLAAEKRAGKNAVIAKERGDLEAAQKHKAQELINFYLWREANAAKDKGEKINAYLKGIQSRDYKNSKIDKEYVAKAKQLIAAYDFRKGIRESEELASTRLEAVRNWIESQKQDPENNAAFVEAEILGRLIQRKEMTVDDLTGLNDVVKSIMFTGRRNAEADQEAYRQNIEAGVESLEKNRINTYPTEIDSDLPWNKAKNFAQQFFASLRKMESLARQADGMNEQGWMWKNTIKPLLDAANNSLSMRTRAHTELNEMFEGYNGVFSGFKGVRTFSLESGQTIKMSYGARISLALNMGNDGNMEALLNQGSPSSGSRPLMTRNDIDKIVSTLSDSDWDLVQNIWDYVDSYWPMIAELELKRSGVAPQKVKPTPFKTPSGRQMKGGYYPLAGDPAEDSKQLDQDITQQAELMKQGGTARKSTKHGSTIERVGFGGKKIDFSIDVLFNHIDGIIHDVTHWEAIRSVDRVLRNPKIQKELNESLGKPGARVFKDRLAEVAAGPQRVNGLHVWTRALRYARLAATYNALGYSVRTALMNTMGLTTAIAEMDAKSITSATAEYYGNIKATNEFILSKSEYMRDRGEVLNRDIAYIRANLKGSTTLNKFRDNAFWLMTQTDKAITRPIWLAAYRKGETMFETEQEAIDYADRMVARTQGSGLDMDLANVETRNELMKTMTVMYSAMSAIYNITVEQAKKHKAGKITTPQLVAKMAWLLIAPGILTSLFLGKDEEDDELAETVIDETAAYSLGLLPVFRDLYSAAKYGSTFPTPLIQLGSHPVELYKQVKQGEADRALVRSITGMAAWAHIPGGEQINRTLGYMIELNEGEVESFSPYELIVTGKERK